MRANTAPVPSRRAIVLIASLFMGVLGALMIARPVLAVQGGDLAVPAEATSAVPSSDGSAVLKTASVSNSSGTFSVVPNRKTANKATLKARLNSGYVLLGIDLDGSHIWTNSKLNPNLRSVTKVINLGKKKYATGDHTVEVYAGNFSSGTALVAYSVTIPKLPKPNYNGVFEVYSKYLNYSPYSFGGNQESYKLYLEYSKNGGKTWKRSGYMRCNSIKLYTQQSYTIKGLKPNKKYKTRIRYGTIVDGRLYLGPVRKTKTIKTGNAKKPPIKSVKAQAVNVRYHKIRHYGPYTGVYLYTEKFYTYKIKVTVKLKKKPGAAGLCINGKYVKGNKKSYTVKFSPYPNYAVKKPPKGMRYKVRVSSYKAKSYGGYSPTYKKTKKVVR